MVKRKKELFGVLLSLFMILILSGCDSRTYVVVDTMQGDCYDTEGNVIECGSDGDLLGQDAEYVTTPSDYTSSDDLTVVTDNNTELMWEYAPSDTNEYAYDDAAPYCDAQTTGGYDDWRLPSLKELYSLADFNGALSQDVAVDSVPYIDTDYFEFNYFFMPFATQYWSSSEYQINMVAGSPDEDSEAAGYWPVFGFNFADGHIKAYGTGNVPSGLYIRCVRGDEDVYGVNDFELNPKGTIVTDHATDLMWQQDDGGETYTWGGAMDHCEELRLEGYNDWRLPDNKELQSIVDYDALETPAIDTDYFDSTFNSTYDSAKVYSDDGGDYGWYWSSTTIGDFPMNGSYFAFGRAYSTMNMGISYDLIEDEDERKAALAAADYYDYHGAGAQRSDPKDPDLVNDGTGCSDFACDEERGYNYARCVRGIVEY